MVSLAQTFFTALLASKCLGMERFHLGFISVGQYLKLSRDETVTTLDEAKQEVTQSLRYDLMLMLQIMHTFKMYLVYANKHICEIVQVIEPNHGSLGLQNVFESIS